MWPTLISIGPIIIYSFGVFLALGIFFGGFVFWQKARQEGINEEELIDGWLTAGIVSLITARAWFVLVNWSEFNHWYRIIFLTKFPGLAYEGALIGFWLALIFWIYKKQWNFWQILEVAIFSELIMEIFGWLGTWLARGKLVLPKELFLAAGLFLSYKLLHKWEKQYRSNFKPGFLVAVYLIILGTANVMVRMGLGIVLISGGLLLLLNRWDKLTELIKHKPEKKPDKIKRKKLGFDFK